MESRAERWSLRGAVKVIVNAYANVVFMISHYVNEQLSVQYVAPSVSFLYSLLLFLLF